MTRDTPRGLGPPPPADATDPSVLAELTDPDGLSFDAETATEPGEAVDALAAFEQRRRIYPQAAGSSSSDGSVAASYHAVHDVPRAHHDTLPNAVSSAPVVVDIVTERVPRPVTEPVTLSRSAPERANDRGRDVSTFPLPRERLRRPVLIAVLAALAGVAALLVVVVLRVAGGSPEHGTTGQRAAASEAAPLAIPVPPPTAPSATAFANDVAPTPAAPATTSAPRELPPVRPLASSSPRARPSVPPPSTPSNATPATARPAGAFDDLVRETKP